MNNKITTVLVNNILRAARGADGEVFDILGGLDETDRCTLLGEAFNKAAEQGDQDVFKKLSSFLPDANHNGLFIASKFNHLSVVEFLLPFSSLDAIDEAAYIAARAGHTDAVALLSPHLLAHGNFQALSIAAEEGHLGIVEILYKNADPSARTTALCHAVKEGRLSVVQYIAESFFSSGISSFDITKNLWDAICKKYNSIAKLLIPFADAKLHHSKAIQMASYMQNEELFDLLYEISDPHEALSFMRDFYMIWLSEQDNTNWQLFLETRMNARESKKDILEGIDIFSKPVAAGRKI